MAGVGVDRSAPALSIAWVTDQFSQHERGQIEGLLARGARVVVVDPYGRRSRAHDGWRSIVEIRSLKGEWEEACRTRRLPVLSHARTLARCLRETGASTAQACWVQTDGLILAVSGFHPFVLHPFGSDLLLRARDSLRASRLAREVLLAADRIVFCSRVLRDAAVRLAGHSPLPSHEVIPVGVDTVCFRPEGADGSLRAGLGVGERPLAVSTRNLAPVYGVDRLLRAFARARKSVPEAFLALCGDGPLRGELEALARSLGIGEAVRFLGRVDRDLLPLWLPDADLYVSASLSDGASVSLMEAMACGLPCVVSGIGANREMVEEGKTGFCADYDAPEAAGRIVEVLRDTARARAMGREARAAAVERYDAARAHDRLWALHRTLAGVD